MGISNDVLINTVMFIKLKKLSQTPYPYCIVKAIKIKDFHHGYNLKPLIVIVETHDVSKLQINGFMVVK